MAIFLHFSIPHWRRIFFLETLLCVSKKNIFVGPNLSKSFQLFVHLGSYYNALDEQVHFSVQLYLEITSLSSDLQASPTFDYILGCCYYTLG